MLKRFFAALICGAILLGTASAHAQGTEPSQPAAGEGTEQAQTVEAPKSVYDGLVYAEVTTRKGKLNMRKSAKEKSSLVVAIPNHSILLVLEKGDEWSLVSYKEKQGYVKNEFITVYDPLPFEEMASGDKSDNVLELKKRLKALGYLGKSIKADKVFDKALKEAVERFQQYSGLEVTGIVTPELCAYILWNDLAKYDTDGGSTDPLSGLSCKLSYSISNYRKKDNGNVTMSVKYSTKISGGTEPYKIKVKLIEAGMNEADAPLVESNPFTFEWYSGSTAETFKLLLVVTDANGVSVSAVKHCAMDIPYSMFTDSGDTGETGTGDTGGTDDETEWQPGEY